MGDVWMVSDDQERWSTDEEFDTREEAIAWGIEEFRAEGCARFWVGKKAPYLAVGVGEALACDLLERHLSDDSFEFAGDEATEGWPSHSMWPGRNPDGTKKPLEKIEQELADRLQAVVDWYLTQDPPSFCGLEAVEEVEIPDETAS